MTFHKGGSVRKALTFNAQNSNFDSWFRQERLTNSTNSSWSDLISFEGIDIFSLKGPCSADGRCRNLLINKYAPDCNGFGWIYRGTYSHCNWEANTLHDIVYCKGTTICQFKKQGECYVRGFLTTTLSQS